MELLAIGFLGGVCFTFVIAGAAVYYDDRVHKGKSDADPDVRLYVLSRHRNRRSTKRIYTEVEDVKRY